jgi:hypothetical protein
VFGVVCSFTYYSLHTVWSATTSDATPLTYVNLSGLCRPPAIFQLCFTAVGVSHQQNHSAAVLYAAVSAT